MDKTKYNRAAKDPTQLQNFVDEVCEGGAIGEHVEIDVKQPYPIGKIEMGYDEQFDDIVIETESDGKNDEGIPYYSSIIQPGYVSINSCDDSAITFSAAYLNKDGHIAFHADYGTSTINYANYDNNEHSSYLLDRPGGFEHSEYIQTITDPQNVAYLDIGRSYVQGSVATIDLTNYIYKIVIMRKAQISAEEILLLFPRNHTRACCVSGDSFTSRQCAPEKVNGDDNQVNIRLDATVLTDEDNICVDLTNPVFCKLSITTIGH